MIMRFVVSRQAFVAFILGFLTLFTGAAYAKPPVSPASEESTAEASRLVAEVLSAEARGDTTSSTAQLHEAIAMAPDYGPPRWHLGQVKIDGLWMTLDQSEAQGAADGRLAEYRELRAQATNNPKDNLALARWCKTNRLEAERRFHLANVMRAIPNHREVIRGLGLRRVGGRLMSLEQIEMLRSQARWKRESSEIWKPRVSRLMRLARSADLDERAEAKKQFLAIDDPRAIGPLRGALSMTDARHPVRVLNTKSKTYAARHQRNLLLIAILSQMPQQSATIALLGESVLSPSAEIRMAAADELKKRPLHNFVPQLLAGLTSPIEVRIGILRDAHGRVMYSRTFFRSGPLADVAITFDAFIGNSATYLATSPDGNYQVREPSPVSPGTIKRLKHSGDKIKQRVDAVNEKITQLNERIRTVVTHATAVTLEPEPRFWWKWWQDYNELYLFDEKPIYEKSFSDYYNYGLYAETARRSQSPDYPARRPVTTQGRAVRSGRSSGVCSCFARGTLVPTNAGPQNIENIRLGDQVLSQDVDSGELTYKTVVGRTVRPAAPLLRITVGDESFTVTRGHPFWVSGTGWQMAKQLKPGQHLHGPSGSRAIDSIGEAVPEPTYNLVVSGFNTYFVGKGGILVHDNTPRRPTLAVVPGLSSLEVKAGR